MLQSEFLCRAAELLGVTEGSLSLSSTLSYERALIDLASMRFGSEGEGLAFLLGLNLTEDTVALREELMDLATDAGYVELCLAERLLQEAEQHVTVAKKTLGVKEFLGSASAGLALLALWTAGHKAWVPAGLLAGAAVTCGVAKRKLTVLPEEDNDLS